jgi:holo-[acyl-carrier protein] synthase
MKIIGIGNDIVDIRRIESLVTKYGSRFTNRVFTEIEQKRSSMLSDSYSSYAKRFAAKEACSKALGSGFSSGVHLRDIGVTNLDSGQPEIVLKNGAKNKLESLVSERMEFEINISLSDSYPWAIAMVVISASKIDV